MDEFDCKKAENVSDVGTMLNYNSNKENDMIQLYTIIQRHTDMTRHLLSFS